MDFGNIGDRNIQEFDWKNFFKEVDPDIKYTVLHIVGDQRYVKDIIQEVRLKIWKNLPDFQGKSRLSTWVISIARNTAIDFQKKFNREVPTDINIITDLLDSRHSTETEDGLDLVEAVQGILDSMPNELKEILIKKEVEGLTYKELSVALNLTKRQVETRLNKARIMFKDICLRRQLI